MGIKHLRKILAKYNLFKEVPVSSLRGKRVGIDASLVIYQMHLQGVEGSHLRGVFNRNIAYMKMGIIPVWFFDGTPPALKDSVCDARKAKVDAGKGIKIPAGTFDDVKTLLKLMNIEVIIAPGEAEAQAAHATTVGFIDTVATEDIDALTFGAVSQCFGLNATTRTVKMAYLAEILGALNMGRVSFIDLCILLGSDYTSVTLPGVGPVSALKYIRQYGSIEKIIEDKGIEVPNKFCYKLARAEFLAPLALTEYPPKKSIAVYTDNEIKSIIEFMASKKVVVTSEKLKTIFVGFEGAAN